jgi:hypothetical protein
LVRVAVRPACGSFDAPCTKCSSVCATVNMSSAQERR